MTPHHSTLPARGRPVITRLAAGLVAGAALVSLAACADGGDPMSGHDMSTPRPSGASTAAPTASASVDANSDDAMFAAMMIPHHEQAIMMSDYVLAKKGIDPEVTRLAGQIKDAQQPEIDTMRAWLEAWDTPPDHSTMDHGDGDSGMMTPEELRELKAADSDEAQTMFLEGMIEHHDGAITMAKTEVEKGRNPEAIAMAQAIITSQQAEIDQMRAILARL